MKRNVLIIGSGGREHALAWKVRQDGHRADMATGSIDELLIKAKQYDLTIVGPDQYLADGIVDRFQVAGLRVFGPTRAMARYQWCY